jgi:hypothetical protein
MLSRTSPKPEVRARLEGISDGLASAKMRELPKLHTEE